MRDYGEIVKKILLRTNTEAETDSVMDEVLEMNRDELFCLIKSLALLTVKQQQDINELRRLLTGGSGEDLRSSN